VHPPRTRFHELLRSTFGDDDVVAERLRELEEAEDEGGALLFTFPGIVRIMERVFVFLIETIRLAEAARLRPGAPRYPWHGSLLLDFATHVKRLRAAYRLLQVGYPPFALTLLRDFRERALLYAAILHRATTIREILGLPLDPPAGEKLPPFDARRVVKERKTNQRAALATIDGRESGLEARTSSRLALLKDVLDSEVHGSQISGTEGEAFIRGGPLPIVPMPTRDSVLACLTVTLTASHYLVRTLPVLQLEPGAFGAAWVERWRVMDRVLAWALETERASSAATKELTDKKLAFDPETHAYPGD